MMSKDSGWPPNLIGCDPTGKEPDICPECKREICECPDFKIRDEGTIILFTPLTEAADAFLERCQTEPWQWLGPSLVVDHKPARDLLQAITDEGLTVE